MKRFILLILSFIVSLNISLFGENYYGYITDSSIKSTINSQTTIKPDAIYILSKPAKLYTLTNISNIMRNGSGNKQIIAESQNKETVIIIFKELPILTDIEIWIDNNYFNVRLYK